MYGVHHGRQCPEIPLSTGRSRSQPHSWLASAVEVLLHNAFAGRGFFDFGNNPWLLLISVLVQSVNEALVEVNANAVEVAMRYTTATGNFLTFSRENLFEDVTHNVPDSPFCSAMRVLVAASSCRRSRASPVAIASLAITTPSSRVSATPET